MPLPSKPLPSSRRRTALVLMGGGARTAYQAGVLRTLVQVLGLSPSRPAASPFDILVGTSAGALNAAFLAGARSRWPDAPLALEAFWRDVRSDKVYRIDTLKVAQVGAKWLALLSLGWLLRRSPRSLLDNTPLVDTLHRAIRLDGVEQALRAGEIEALAISASSYATGMHWTFCQTHDSRATEEPLWQRPGRRAVFQPITIEHLVASSAIPFVFPAIPLYVDGRREYFGDGSMRQTAPLSPAIHLGAERIFVVGVGRAQRAGLVSASPGRDGYPSLAHIAGHALASVFHDTVEGDVEQLRNINGALERAPASTRVHLPFRHIDVLTLQPSQSLDDLALMHIEALPPTVRRLLGALGGTEGAGAALSSYLLFEAPFVKALMDLGSADTLARREEIETFFSS